jgi:hypothetical protein
VDPKQRIPLSIDALMEKATDAASRTRAGRHPSPSMAAARPRVIPPSTPLLDARDARQRAGKYRRSRRVCTDGWCHYFDALSAEMDRESP